MIKGTSMILHNRSIALRVLLFVWSPSQRMRPLFPLWITHARVGDNTRDYVRVSLRRP